MQYCFLSCKIIILFLCSSIIFKHIFNSCYINPEVIDLLAQDIVLCIYGACTGHYCFHSRIDFSFLKMVESSIYQCYFISFFNVVSFGNIKFEDTAAGLRGDNHFGSLKSSIRICHILINCAT